MDTLDKHRDLEIFVITNGRDTFRYVMKYISIQSVKRKVTIIRNMKWVDALNKCIELCNCSFFLRVDDDMVLHPFAVAYYLDRMNKTKKKRGGVYVCKLWEDWSNKPAGGLRMYSYKATKKVGGFKSSNLGKVDKVFREQLHKCKYKQIKDPSVVGVHVLASIEDQKKYRDLWRDKNVKISRSKFAKTFDNKIHNVKKSIKKQYSIIKRFHKLNRKYKGRFANFIVRHRQELENNGIQ